MTKLQTKANGKKDCNTHTHTPHTLSHAYTHNQANKAVFAFYNCFLGLA